MMARCRTTAVILGAAVYLSVVLLSGVLAQEACQYHEFKCSSGRCTHMLNLCNGISDCDDKSDENRSLCDKAATVAIGVGETLEARVERKAHHLDVLFQLCGAAKCSQIGAIGVAPDGRLFWTGRTDCNAMGGNCQQQLTWMQEGWQRFPEGSLVFEVQRSAGELAVWMQGRPDVKMTVPVAADSGTLRVRPLYWYSDMPVAFRRLLPGAPGQTATPATSAAEATTSAAPKSCQYHEFRCSDGLQCVHMLDLCNGLAECADGSDENRTRCDRIPQTNIEVGEVVTARVQRKEHHIDILFHLCDETACSQIGAIGAASDGSFFWTAHTDCNAMGGHCANQVMWMQEGWRRFLAGTLVFEVERSEDELAVWLKGRPERQMTVAVRPGSGRLRIRPLYMYSDMPVTFRHSRPTAAPAPPAPAVHAGGPQTGGSLACGAAPKVTATLTVNGEKSAPGAFPWHAALYRRVGVAINYICGGSLVSAKFIVTAAHCFFENDKQHPAERHAVALGKIYSGWADDEVGVAHKSNVSRVLLHPLYRGVRRKYADDVALLQMQSVATFSEYIVPICIDDRIAMAAGDLFRVIGWGAGENALKELESIVLKFKTFDTCLDAISHNPPEVSFMTTDKFCALKEKDVVDLAPGLAHGDSGGGAAMQRGDRWFLVGVVSTAMDRGKIFGFSDMRKHGAWVAQTIAEDPLANRLVFT